MTTFTGNGTSGNVDGSLAAARFSSPLALAIDSANTIYVADSAGSYVRKIQSGTVTTLAGTAGVLGTADGTGAAAQFSTVSNMAVDSSGNIWAVDQGGFTIRKITSANVVTTVAGTAGVTGRRNATGLSVLFASPTGIALESSGHFLICEDGAIRRMTPAGVVTTVAGIAHEDGTGGQNSLGTAIGVTFDTSGLLHYVDFSYGTLRKSDSQNRATFIAGNPNLLTVVDGTGTAASFQTMLGLAIDSAGSIFVSDKQVIRKVTAAGVVTTFAGSSSTAGTTDATGTAARFGASTGAMVVDASDNLLVIDASNKTIRKITPAGVVTTFAGSAGVSGSADGTGILATFSFTPGFANGLAIDSVGTLYVADAGARKIRKITAAGVVTTIAGTGANGSADGLGTVATFGTPCGLALSLDGGSLYVADASRYNLRKIDLATNAVTTVAGIAGSSGSTDSTTLLSAQFLGPQAMAIDSSGNLYVGDGVLIRKVQLQ